MSKHSLERFGSLPGYYYWGILLLTSFLLYGNTLTHDYALDDAIVITKNDFTKEGVQGIPDILTNDSFTGFFGQRKDLVKGGRYRPLSQVMFAIEYELFGFNPFVGHFINVLLYGFLAITLFQFIFNIGMHRFAVRKTTVLLALLTSLFFIAHPVHTEVVANIKGRDEILALLLGTLTLLVMFKAMKKNSIRYTFGASGIYLLALLSKENAAIFIFLIPLTVWFFLSPPWKQMIQFHAPLVLVLTGYVLLRGSILGNQTGTSNELLNNPFIEALPSEKAGTILYTLGFYLRLLVFPHPLTYDYYPYHIELFHWKSAIPILVFVMYFTILVIMFVTFKKKNIVSYSILWYLIPLVPVSNIFFPVGVFMGERFVFISSVGFCLFLAFLITRYLIQKQKFEKIAAVLVIMVLGLYSFKTIDRNKTWKDDFTLFTTDVLTSRNSAKANTTAGGALYEKALTIDNPQEKRTMLYESKQYLRRAISIYPGYVDARLLLGNVQWELYHRFDSVWPHYSRILDKSPRHNQTLDNMRAMATQLEKPRPKIDILRTLHRYRPNSYDINYMLGSTYGKSLQQMDSARHFLQRAVEISSKTKALKDLGVAYGMSGKPQKAIPLFEQALAKDSTDQQLYINLGVSHRQLGNLKKAREYFEKAKKIDE